MSNEINFFNLLFNGLLLLMCIEWISLDAHGRFCNCSTSM